MRLLIDTHVLIWWMADDLRLGRKARGLLSDPGVVLLASLVSIWEITMKWRAGKFPVSGGVYLDFLEDEGVLLLDPTRHHLLALEALPTPHKDPFDHLLIAQAQVEHAHLLTNDREMTLYGIPCYPASR